jgi:hypothetical protein
MSKMVFAEKGQALILIVLVITVAVGMVGLSLDAGNSFSNRRQAQNAADAAAIAAAYAKIQGGNIVTTARNLAGQNGFVNNDGTTKVLVNNPPVGGDYNGNADYIQVVIENDVETWFAQIIGIESTHNTVEAISHATPSQWTPLYQGNALVALKTTGKGVFRSHGDNNTNVYGAGIFVNSNDACAFEQMGNSVLNVPEAAVQVVGKACMNGSISPASTITTEVQPVPYPPISLPEEPVCATEATQEGNELNPGNWEGSFPPKGVTFLRPGIYCIDGTFMMNAHEVLKGDGVLLYMRSGNIHWNGLAEINLTGYTTAPYPGLLIYMPMSNAEGIILNGNSNSTFAGSILAPASDVQINGTERSDTYQTQIIAYTIDLIGTMDLNVNYNENILYHHLDPANLELIK